MTYLNNAWRKYWHLWLALALAPMIFWLFEATPLDRTLIGWYYDAHAHGFPLRDSPFMQNVMHTGLKMVMVVFGAAVLIAFLLTFIRPQWRAHRRRLLWLFAAMAGGPMLVSLFKATSPMHCPWDLAEYGGYAPFNGLFEHLPAGIAAGHCFPGGHASGGFALMAFYFALRDTHQRAARLFLVIGLAAGMLMGWAQMMRGAHFLSHNVWSAWVVWVFLSVFYYLLPPVPAGDAKVVSVGRV
ncbi:MAG TPA: phosphatase PAP2 family protein [Noviherbaspirillum sp.]|uniref:phosphatase PAP2 family protein n=1 Tax=Noviherbaspirillum sp. TaxID=1926288 RepID=UPI002B47C062|nr:phosphatase PAP2 family protein [Noviherbaspirillum sp.]HJV87367.1 phosphatase PAP2 family protein [Noviherbaspirillum sp.]